MRPRHARAAACVQHLHASSSSCARQSWPRQQTRVQRCTRRCHSHRKDACIWAVTGAATKSCCLRSSSHVLPHDQEEHEGGFGYKRSLSPTDSTPRSFYSKGHTSFHLLPLHNAHFHCCSLSRWFPINGVPVLHSVAA